MTPRPAFALAAPVVTRHSSRTAACAHNRSHRPSAPPPRRQRASIVAVYDDDDESASTGSGAAIQLSSEQVVILSEIPTPGGWIIDVAVTDNSEDAVVTKHTEIVGKIHMAEICGEAGVEVIPAEAVVQWTFQYFLSIGKELARTEGMMDPEIFPMNYFSFRTVFNYCEESAVDSFMDFVKMYHAQAT